MALVSRPRLPPFSIRVGEAGTAILPSAGGVRTGE